MQVSENISLKNFNSFGLDVYAQKFASFGSADELAELLSIEPRSSLVILGGGSNILFTKDVAGLVLKNDMKGIELVKEDTQHYYIKAYAGENWHGFVQHCLARNYAGIENLALIPGNVGASPMQNIGAYGVEIKDVFQQLEAYHISEKKLVSFSLNDCRLGYRESVFKKEYQNQFVILSVIFRLNKIPVINTSYGAIAQELEKMQVKELSIQAIADAVIRIRSSKLPDPARVGNAGSFFKNPVVSADNYTKLKEAYPAISAFKVDEGHYKLAAGWLIEQCGWKGYRKGDAGCYDKQALVLVNYGQATGQEIFMLSSAIIESVTKKFGVVLEREVNIL